MNVLGTNNVITESRMDWFRLEDRPGWYTTDTFTGPTPSTWASTVWKS